MCTAIIYRTRDAYFGRTLDVECGYQEQIVVTPRHFPLLFRHTETVRCHAAIIGTAAVIDGTPLYFDGANEHGLAMAGLHFPQNAHYAPLLAHKDNIASFELIPWLLSQCRCVSEARTLLAKLSICDTPFAAQVPTSPLHWMLADSDSAVVIEQTKDGLRVYDDPVGVMTNNPPFPYHLTHLCDYQSLSCDAPINRFASIDLTPYSRGMGAMGLPGDLSSASRFVRAAFARAHAVSDDTTNASVSQVFHILGSVEQPRGCVLLSDGQYELTAYSCCIHLKRGVYYYKTYDSHRIHAVDMHRCDIDGDNLTLYPMKTDWDVDEQN